MKKLLNLSKMFKIIKGILYIIQTLLEKLKINLHLLYVNPKSSKIISSCTLCGNEYLLDKIKYNREAKLCNVCGANGSFQAIFYRFSQIVLNKTIPLKLHTNNKTIKILGMSDDLKYANILNTKYNYINTLYHKEPFFNITDIDQNRYMNYDILISTEVFEHIIRNTLIAFKSVLKILKLGGSFIFNVPFINNGNWIEHYSNKQWEVELSFENGDKKINKNPKFHGGSGSTLEIRLLNRKRLMLELEEAGFCNNTGHDENLPKHGIYWEEESRCITAKKPKCIQ